MSGGLVISAHYDVVTEKWVVTDDLTQITVRGKVRSQAEEERLAEAVTGYHQLTEQLRDRDLKGLL